MRRRWFWFAALIGLVAPRPASAQEDPRERADLLLREGAELGKQGKDDEAIARFKEAERIYPRAIHDCNIGLVYARTKRWPQAHLFLTRCRERWARQETRPLPGWVTTRLRAVHDQLDAGGFAPITLTVNPPTATLTTSAFAADETFTARVIWLPLGTHQVTATAGGYQPRTIPIEAATPARQTISISLAPEPGPVEEPGPTEPEPELKPVEPEPAPVEAREPAVTEPLPHPPPSDTRRRSVAPWLVTATGVAAMSAGGYFYYVAATTDDDVEAGTKSRDDWKRDETLGYGLFWGGAAVTTAGIVWLYLTRDRGDASDRPTVGAVPGPGGGYVWLEWSL